MAQIRLKTRTATEIRRTLSRVMNMVANGEMDNKTADRSRKEAVECRGLAYQLQEARGFQKMRSELS